MSKTKTPLQILKDVVDSVYGEKLQEVCANKKIKSSTRMERAAAVIKEWTTASEAHEKVTARYSELSREAEVAETTRSPTLFEMVPEAWSDTLPGLFYNPDLNRVFWIGAGRAYSSLPAISYERGRYVLGHWPDNSPISPPASRAFRLSDEESLPAMLNNLSLAIKERK